MLGACGAAGSSGRREAATGDVLAHGPGQIVLTRMHDRSRLLVFRMPAAMVGWPQAAVRTGLAPQLPRLGRERLALLGRVAQLFFDECAVGGMASRDQTVGVELQRLLVSLLGVRAVGGHIRDGASLLPASVRRAQALMAAAPAGDLPLSVLAGRCGISVRTLQENFRRFAGTTPLDWWRGYRLDRVRAMLRSGDTGLSVTDVAMAFGFTDLGRFAAHYRLRFGEPPSETLRAARRARDE